MYIDGTSSRLQIEHDGVAIRDVQSFDYEISRDLRARGEGIGFPTQTEIVPGVLGAGTFNMTLKKKTDDDQGGLFEDLMHGSAITIRETIAASSSTHTLAEAGDVVAILEIRYNTTTDVTLLEGRDYVVNYSTGVITFDAATAEAATVKYVVDSPIMGANLMENYCFEYADVDSLWAVISAGAATMVRSSAQQYVGTHSLLCTPGAQNDGCEYVKAMTVIPGQQYRFRFAIRGVLGDTFTVNFVDTAGAVAMTPVGAAGALAAGATWYIWEYTFTPDDATIDQIEIINTDVAAGAFNLDHLQLGLDAPLHDFGDGQLKPFPFNVVQYDLDGKRLRKFIGCQCGTLGGSMGGVDSDQEENWSGMFIRMLDNEA
ncbi:MAG: carbohydrate binding domain-containing protein [Polyangiaceae bacterium]|nr:carbohydrate binding domain-containing protein [Polyangiaceae bacterium]